MIYVSARSPEIEFWQRKSRGFARLTNSPKSAETVGTNVFPAQGTLLAHVVTATFALVNFALRPKVSALEFFASIHKIIMRKGARKMRVNLLFFPYFDVKIRLNCCLISNNMV